LGFSVLYLLGQEQEKRKELNLVNVRPSRVAENETGLHKKKAGREVDRRKGTLAFSGKCKRRSTWPLGKGKLCPSWLELMAKGTVQSIWVSQRV